jgi:hypothetical protein
MIDILLANLYPRHGGRRNFGATAKARRTVSGEQPVGAKLAMFYVCTDRISPTLG